MQFHIQYEPGTFQLFWDKSKDFTVAIKDEHLPNIIPQDHLHKLLKCAYELEDLTEIQSKELAIEISQAVSAVSHLFPNYSRAPTLTIPQALKENLKLLKDTMSIADWIEDWKKRGEQGAAANP